MTDQEAFDKIVARLMDGTGPAVNEKGDCMYRAPNGLKCAVGCLIPDDKYDLRMEGRAVGQFFKLGFNCLEGLNIDMLALAQDVHDSDYSWDGNTLNAKGIEELRYISEDFNLTMKEKTND